MLLDSHQKYKLHFHILYFHTESNFYLYIKKLYINEIHEVLLQ